MEIAILQWGRPLADALADRIRRLGAVVAAIGHAQRRRPSVRERQAMFALSTAFLGAVVLAVVGARASEPLSDPSQIKQFGQSKDPPPLLLRPLAKSAAIAMNESIGFSKDVNYPAAPFVFTGDSSARERALQCLTAAVYYEAASEGPVGEQAVAQVVLNRVRNPSFPSSICQVVYQGSLLRTGCQFSFTCDGSLQRVAWKPEWLKAEQIAEAALAGAVMPQVGLSTHYHTIDVVPYWATSLAKDAQVGRHIFYRWPGSWGRPGAFRQKYAGSEPDAVALRDTALVAKGIWPTPMDGETGPDIQVVSDPKLEAAAIVELLSREPAAKPTAFETAARSHFAKPSANGSDDKAATAQSNDNAASAVDDAVDTADLATSSLMREFLLAHRHDYKAAAVVAAQRLQSLTAQWQIYTGSQIGRQRVKLLLSDSLNEPRCTAALPAGPLLPNPSAIQAGDYELFMASGLPNALVATGLPAKSGDGRAMAKLIDKIRADVVFAVFSRIAALSGGQKEQAPVLRVAAAQGRSLVPVLAKRLEAFESSRAQYPTLADFLPQLLNGLPLDQATDVPATDDAADQCGWMPPVSIASADARPIMAGRDLRP